MTTQTQAPTAADTALDAVEIFRPGRHMAMNGAVIEFSTADVAAIAAAYNPALHEAPHVVGHPTTDGPAYGWVQALGVNGAGRLCVTASRQVQTAFADMVGEGRFKKRSAAFYPPAHLGNPTPGRWYLKHVGWLGATPPAVKGLADVATYGEAEADLVEFGDWDDELNAGLWRRMREWFIGQFGADTADKVLPAFEIDALQREAMRPEPELIPTPTNTATTYAEGALDMSTTITTAAATDAALTARSAALDARDTLLRSQEATQAALLRSARTAGIAAFADGLVQAGKLLPPERARIVALAEALPDSIEVIEFADGDPAKPVTRTPMQVLQDFFAGLPPRVDFAERAKPDGALQLNTQDPHAISRAAAAYQFAERQAGREVGLDVAVEHVVRQAAG